MTALRKFFRNQWMAAMLALIGLLVHSQRVVLAQEPSVHARRIAMESPSAEPASAKSPSADLRSADLQSAGNAGARMDLHDIGAGEVLHITVGHSMVLRGENPVRRIYIENPSVLQSFTAGPSEVVLTAKTSGLSSLVLWDAAGQSSLYTVAADVDPDALRQSLQEAYPGSQIGVQGHEGRIYLTGTVPTQEVADGARSYRPPMPRMW